MPDCCGPFLIEAVRPRQERQRLAISALPYSDRLERRRGLHHRQFSRVCPLENTPGVVVTRLAAPKTPQPRRRSTDSNRGRSRTIAVSLAAHCVEKRSEVGSGSMNLGYASFD